MARETILIIRCDLCASRDGSAATFAVNGRNYELDLCDKCLGKLDSALEPFIAHAKGTGRARKVSAKRGDLNEIRAWGRAKGYTVSDRGRVAQEIVDAFDAERKAS